MFLWVIAIFFALASAYAVFSLWLWVVKELFSFVHDQSKVKQWRNLRRNILSNWFFPISALAFFELELTSSLENSIGILIAFLLSVAISSQIGSLLIWQRKFPVSLRVVSALSAFGMCYFRYYEFRLPWTLTAKFRALQSILHLDISTALFTILLIVLIATLFLYFAFLFLWGKVISVLKRIRDFFRPEPYRSRVLLDFVSALGSIHDRCFFKSNEPYKAECKGSPCVFDVIYTSDSGSIVGDNAYLLLTHGENDLRQPLFAVFAAPFIGIPYLIGKIFSASTSVKAILMNSVQIALLFLSSFMISEMMELKKVRRACFILLTCSCYTYMLSTVMMEQYVFAFFWLILACYQYIIYGKTDSIVLYGAGGTLLSSLALLPTISSNSVKEDFRAWRKDVVHGGIGFITLMLCFGRYDVLSNLTRRINWLFGFAGEAVPLWNKFLQYLSFIASCFLRPAAGINLVMLNYPSWQLKPVTSISIFGIILLMGAIVSAVMNWNKRITKLAAFWAFLSFLLLFGLGWGTQENGLILYSLYFGWAFEILVFELLVKFGDEIKLKYFPEAVSVVLACLMLIVNSRAMSSLVEFASTYYPVLK